MTTKQYLAALAVCILIGFRSSWGDHAIEPGYPGSGDLWHLLVDVPPARESFHHARLSDPVLTFLNIKQRMLLTGTVTQGLFLSNCHKPIWIHGHTCVAGVAIAWWAVHSWVPSAQHPLPTLVSHKRCLEWLWFLEKQKEKLKSVCCIFLALRLPVYFTFS